MNSQPPVRKPDIHTKDLGTETLLYSAKFGAIHILNPTAKCIWEMCDGQHTMEEMAHIRAIAYLYKKEKKG
ncbi:PqqD family protein [Chloroflexi bacterium TSY]|nr:PqqD family protein [Chloroflexi bacterium TSY]